MSGFFRVQVNIPMDSGIPEDEVVNVWHFDSDQTFAEDADDVAGRVVAFYQAIDQLVFPAHVATPGRIKVYDLADPEPRAPGVEEEFTITPSAAGSFPHEVAITLSFRAAIESGANMARRRGRVFLGPVQTGLATSESGKTRVDLSQVQPILTALDTLAEGPDPGDGRLAVFSPTTAGPPPWTEAELAAAFNDVEHFWIDNAFDTIRSRGTKPSARVTGNV